MSIHLKSQLIISLTVELGAIIRKVTIVVLKLQSYVLKKLKNKTSN